MNMSTKRVATLVLAAGFTTAAGAASITLHKQSNFGGEQVTLHDALDNLASVGFRDRTGSMVLNGTWEVCSQPDYRGECVVLGPGRYGALDAKLGQRIASARPLSEGDSTRRAERAASGGQAMLYKQPNFTGGTMPLSETSTNLAKQGFQNQASSAVITGTAWEFCSRPEFRGDCVVLKPGRYERLDQKIYHRMESARPVGENWPAQEKQRTALAQREDRRDAREERRESREFRRGDRGAIDLYPGSDFNGRPLRLEGDAETLDGSRMQERVSSIVVHDGTWQLCTRPAYEGRCRTFEPGRYATLAGMDDRVASAKLLR